MNSSVFSILPNIPDEIQKARIGSCYNKLTNQIIQGRYAFDPSKIPDTKLLFKNGTGQLKCIANASSQSATNGSFFQLDTSATGGYEGFVGGVSASVKFNMESASASSTSNTAFNCFCSYIYSGQTLELVLMNENKLYNIMDDSFQDAYNAITQAKTPEEYINNYITFTNTYGYGCVTKLFLTAGSAFSMSVKYDDTADSNRQKYGGGVTVKGHYGGGWGGGSVSADWMKDLSTTKSTAGLEIVTLDIPETAPTSQWCKDMLNMFTSYQLNTLIQKPQSITPPVNTSYPRDPQLPNGLPTKRTKPEPLHKPSQDNLNEAYKNKRMKEDNYEGTWDNYKKDQNKLYTNLDPKSIVEEVRNRKKSNLYNKIELDSRDNANDYPKDLTASFSVTAWDMGGYIPFAYCITPWNALLPSLLKCPAYSCSTNGNIYIAKIYYFHLTRLQLLQYLNFLCDIGREICQNEAIQYDAICYQGICDSLLAKINALVSRDTSKEPITQLDFDNIVDSFESELDKKIKNNLFNSKLVYDLFYEHYSFFVDNNYGFINVIDKNYYYDDEELNPSLRPVPKPFSLMVMLENAIRCYPIIDNTGKFSFYQFNMNQGWEIIASFHKPNFIFEYDEHNARYIECVGSRFYGIGSDNTIEGCSVRGVPMIVDFPFQIVNDSAKPDS